MKDEQEASVFDIPIPMRSLMEFILMPPLPAVPLGILAHIHLSKLALQSLKAVVKSSLVKAVLMVRAC